MLPGRSRASVLVFLLPPLLLYVVAVALPIVQSLVLSFFSWDGVTDPVRVRSKTSSLPAASTEGERE